jgi:hypothetical protein
VKSIRAFLLKRSTQRIIIALLFLSVLLYAVQFSMKEKINRELAAQRVQLEQAVAQKPKVQPSILKKKKTPVYLDGQYKCFADGMTAEIGQGKMALTYPKSAEPGATLLHVIFDGDCMYTWPTDVAGVGSRQCGLKQYLDVAGTLSSLSGGRIDIRDLMSTLQNSGQATGQAAKMSALLDSCHAESVPQSTFATPKSVRFIEKK